MALTLAVALGACAPSHQPDPAAPGKAEPAPVPAAAGVEPSAELAGTPILPIAENTFDLLDDAPNVVVRGSAVWVDDEQVADVSAIQEGGRLQRVDGLYDRLKSMREAWQAANPGRRFPGVVLHWFDPDLPALVVKSVFQTAAFAGYPHAGFAVRTPGDPSRVSRLGAEARLPGPPAPAGSPTLKPERTLHVEVLPNSDFLLVWKHGVKVIRTVQVPHEAVMSRLDGTEHEFVRFPELTAAILREWGTHGTHRAAEDGEFDRAIVHVGNSTPHKQIVAMLDAVYAPKRKFGSGGAVDEVPAFRATLAITSPPDPVLARNLPADPTLAGASTVSGRLAPAKIRAVIRANFGIFEKCYKAGLVRNPKLTGKVTVRFVIGRDGRVSNVAVHQQTLPDEAAVQCIVEGYKTLVFPRPEGGIVTVLYPIVLATE